MGDGLVVRLGRLLEGRVGLGPPADRRLGMDGLKPGVEAGLLRKPACCARRAFALALTISSAVMGLHEYLQPLSAFRPTKIIRSCLDKE